MGARVPLFSRLRTFSTVLSHFGSISGHLEPFFRTFRSLFTIQSHFTIKNSLKIKIQNKGGNGSPPPPPVLEGGVTTPPPRFPHKPGGGFVGGRRGWLEPRTKGRAPCRHVGVADVAAELHPHLAGALGRLRLPADRGALTALTLAPPYPTRGF